MGHVKYEEIYQSLKGKIETQQYPTGSILPSEKQLTEEYQCSRNTVRRAIQLLVESGYVQPQKGKGVRIIYTRPTQTSFSVGGIESFIESARRNGKKAGTKLLNSQILIADEKISQKTGFDIGKRLLYLERLRYLDNQPLILDYNYFDTELAPGITDDIAVRSIYDYLENTLSVKIGLSKRILTVERATERDKKFLDMKDYDCVAVIAGQVFDIAGQQMEYTQSRHQPDYFSFQDVATRNV